MHRVQLSKNIMYYNKKRKDKRSYLKQSGYSRKKEVYFHLGDTKPVGNCLLVF